MFFREGVVDGVDAWNEEPHGDEEANAWSEVDKADLEGAEAVAIAVDGFELGIETVSGCENESLIARHH